MEKAAQCVRDGSLTDCNMETCRKDGFLTAELAKRETALGADRENVLIESMMNDSMVIEVRMC